MKILSNSVKDTLRTGSRIARFLRPGDIICLEGEIGLGKTIMAKGLALGLGVEAFKVTSSSFVLIREHTEGRLPFYHFDLYRLRDPLEIASLGYEEYFYGDGVSAIEWPQRLGCLMPKECLLVKLNYKGPNERILNFSGTGQRYKELIDKINEDIGN